jgi:hypothetical protein
VTILDLPVDPTTHASQAIGVDGDLLATGQPPSDTHTATAGCEPSAATEPGTKPTPGPSPQTLDTGRITYEPHAARAGVDLLPADRCRHEAQATPVGGDPSPTPATVGTHPFDATPGWDLLRFWAEMYHDAQKVRIGMGNRAGRTDLNPDLYAPAIEAAKATEHACKLELVRCYRKTVPAEVRAWQKEQPGIGEHLLARLLGHLGDPLIATPYRWMETAPDGHECDPNRCGKRHLVEFEHYERTVSELWSYCGHGDAARKKTKGMTQDDAMSLGSPGCKMLVHLLAEACMKQKGKGARYRDVYEKRRAITVDRVDAAGKPWTAAHQHNDALRIVGKELLRDLWLCRHTANQSRNEAQWISVGGDI